MEPLVIGVIVTAGVGLLLGLGACIALGCRNSRVTYIFNSTEPRYEYDPERQWRPSTNPRPIAARYPLPPSPPLLPTPQQQQSVEHPGWNPLISGSLPGEDQEKCGHQS